MVMTELSQLPKLFKTNLAYTFSKMNKQELPQMTELSIVKLFPQRIFKLIMKSCLPRHSRRVRVTWDLLQCKDLARTVPKSMIQESYEKHRRTLTAVGATPQEILTEVRTYFRDFCEEVRKCYRQETKLPPKRAYFNSKFSEGGCFEYLKKQQRFTSSRFESRSVGEFRIDPVVFHLFGKPGKGKSHLSNSIASKLSKRFGFVKSDVYPRSVETEFWDGYRGQLISSIDDCFCKKDDEKDAAQIIQLCSNVDCVLPMADLKEKGRKFTSDFIFLSSNYPHLAGMSSTHGTPLRRRIYPAYELLQRNGDNYRLQKQHYNVDKGTIEPGIILELSRSALIDYVVEDLINTHRSRRTSEMIRIPIDRPGPAFEPGLAIEYPLHPPSRLPKVMAHAIPEPLKVRMITKAEEDLWILKPVQKAMWSALKAFPCFKLTSNPEIPFDFIESWDPKKFILSGDYESATDNLNMDIMQIASEELCKVLPEQMSEWIKWECGVHELHYPPSSKLESVLQTRGQLMGSLLSFPVLCVANAATIGIVKKQSLSDLQSLVNGDDIFFLEFLREINKWKKIASSMGLKPSIGKNYQARDWGSINSQLLLRDNQGKFSHSRTGCFGAISKVSNYIQNMRLALEIEPENKPLFVQKAKSILEKTLQSVDISTEFGGLGFETTREPTLLDKEIYFFKLLNRTLVKVSEIDDSHIFRIPKHLYIQYKNVFHMKRVAESSRLEDMELTTPAIFEFKEFRKFQDRYKSVPYLRERIRSSCLQQEIPLSARSDVTVIVPKIYKDCLKTLKVKI
jgi:hypothetical protein